GPSRTYDARQALGVLAPWSSSPTVIAPNPRLAYRRCAPSGVRGCSRSVEQHDRVPRQTGWAVRYRPSQPAVAIDQQANPPDSAPAITSGRGWEGVPDLSKTSRAGGRYAADCRGRGRLPDVGEPGCHLATHDGVEPGRFDRVARGPISPVRG